MASNENSSNLPADPPQANQSRRGSKDVPDRSTSGALQRSDSRRNETNEEANRSGRVRSNEQEVVAGQSASVRPPSGALQQSNRQGQEKEQLQKTDSLSRMNARKKKPTDKGSSRKERGKDAAAEEMPKADRANLKYLKYLNLQYLKEQLKEVRNTQKYLKYLNLKYLEEQIKENRTAKKMLQYRPELCYPPYQENEPMQRRGEGRGRRPDYPSPNESRAARRRPSNEMQSSRNRNGAYQQPSNQQFCCCVQNYMRHTAGSKPKDAMENRGQKRPQSAPPAKRNQKRGSQSNAVEDGADYRRRNSGRRNEYEPDFVPPRAKKTKGQDEQMIQKKPKNKAPAPNRRFSENGWGGTAQGSG